MSQYDVIFEDKINTVVDIYLFYLNHTQWHSRKHTNTMD